MRFVKSLAPRVEARGIAVNAIAPGFIETRLTDVLPQELKDNLKALSDKPAM